MSPEYVRPYVKAQKNDDRDAEAIAEAATRPTMRFVALKSEELLQQGAGELSSRIQLLIEDMLTRWLTLDERIAAFDAEFAAEAKRDEAARRLTSIPGIGALNDQHLPQVFAASLRSPPRWRVSSGRSCATAQHLSRAASQVPFSAVGLQNTDRLLGHLSLNHPQT
jgi:transposase